MDTGVCDLRPQTAQNTNIQLNILNKVDIRLIYVLNNPEINCFHPVLMSNQNVHPEQALALPNICVCVCVQLIEEVWGMCVNLLGGQSSVAIATCSPTLCRS